MVGSIFFYYAHLFLALTQILHLSLLMGLPVVIQSRFEPNEYCANIEKYKVSISLIVPPILVVLARHPGSWNSQLLGYFGLSPPRQLERNTTYLPYGIYALALLLSAKSWSTKCEIFLWFQQVGLNFCQVKQRLRKTGSVCDITQGKFCRNT